MTDEAPLSPDQPEAVLQGERRRAERFPCTLQPFWRLAGAEDDGEAGASVRDVSTTGIALRLDEPLKLGAVVIINLQARDQRRSRPLAVRVMHVTPQAEGGWVAGCQFIRPLSTQDLEALLAAQ
jgi:hypothetical protein